MNLAIWLELAVGATRSAGKLLLGHGKDAVTDDSGRDIKNLADVEAEKIILDKLNNSGIPILSEEKGESGGSPGTGLAALKWIVDPLDGTLNYTYGIPFCCVSVSLWEDDKPVLGVVYDFNRDELFSGIVGKGAWLNDTPIKPSEIFIAENAVLATGFPVNRDFSFGSLEKFIVDIKKFKKKRLLGSAALSLAYVACGRFDAYREDGIMLWDVAAGVALVEAAGGYVKISSYGAEKLQKSVCAGEVFHG